MIIKNITIDDVDVVGRIYLKAFRYPEGMIRYMGGFEQYVSFFINQGFAFGSFIDDICCGIGMAYETPDMYAGRSIYVDLLAVLPEYQNRGIGKELIRNIEMAAIKHGIHEISIRTACYKPAYFIYNHLNFKDSGGEARYLSKPISMEEFEN
jgi:GNAT superfamily N-acetyltransferase